MNIIRTMKISFIFNHVLIIILILSSDSISFLIIIIIMNII